MKELQLKWFIEKRGKKMLIDAIVVIISYFIGNISSSILIGRLVGGIDIRQHGSGNAGATNVLRTLGKKAAAATLAGDVLKGVIAVLIGKYFGGENLAMACGFVAFIGHIWPVLFGFRGGKGIATGIGVILTTAPFIGLICLVLGIAVIIFSRYVSLGSLVAACALPVTAYFLLNEKYAIWGLALAIIAIYKHRSNIQRLLKGEENKLSFSK